MKKIFKFNDLVSIVENLSAKEQRALASKIMDMMKNSRGSGESKSLSCNHLVEKHLTAKKPDCPHCGVKENLGCIIKRGFEKGVQRYYCKSCGRYFFATTGTAFERTRKDADTWMKFIELTISGASLKKCADECHSAKNVLNVS